MTRIKKQVPKKHKQGDNGIFTQELQNSFIEAYIENNFNISKACEAVGISRVTYYYNVQRDFEFAKMVEMSKVVYQSILRSAIMEGVLSTDLTVRKEYLKLLPANSFANLLGVEEVTNNVNLIINKEDIEIK